LHTTIPEEVIAGGDSDKEEIVAANSVNTPTSKALREKLIVVVEVENEALTVTKDTTCEERKG
jgi:hypothetical protein